jgi:hypothetical protein
MISKLVKFLSRARPVQREVTFPDLPVGSMAIITGWCPPGKVGHRVIKLMSPRYCESRTAVYDLDELTDVPWAGDVAGTLCRPVEWDLSER